MRRDFKVDQKDETPETESRERRRELEFMAAIRRPCCFSCLDWLGVKLFSKRTNLRPVFFFSSPATKRETVKLLKIIYTKPVVSSILRVIHTYMLPTMDHGEN